MEKYGMSARTTQSLSAGLLILSLIHLAGPGQVQAQLAVAEGGPMVAVHTATALQQTLNTAEAIFQSLQWEFELAGYDEHPITFDISGIEGLLGQTTTVLWDIQALNNTISRLFALESAPASSSALQERIWEIRRYQFEVQTAARQIQTLGAQLQKTLHDMAILWDRILHILGGKQGHQQVQALLTQIHQTGARSEVAQAAFQQAMLSRMAEELVIDQAIDQINEEIFASMPRR